MTKKLFHLFILLAPFTSVFPLSAWVRLPVLANLILFLVVIIGLLLYGKMKMNSVFQEDVFLLIFLGLVWISFILGFKEMRSFNHTLAYTNAIVCFFFLSKFVVTQLGISSLQITKTMFYSFLIISIIAIIDFVGINVYDFSLRNTFSTVDGKTSNMDYYIRGGLKRVGGVAEEPGTMALFYNIYFGASLLYLTKKKRVFAIISAALIFIMTYFAIFSTAGIALSVIFFVIVFTIERIKQNKISLKTIKRSLNVLLIFFFATTTLFITDTGGINDHFSEFINKVMFNESGNVTSSGQRVYQWNRAFENFSIHPIFGHGPGYGVHEEQEGYLSVYMSILADMGAVAFLAFLLFLALIFKKAFNLSQKTRPFLLFALFTSVSHLFIVSDFYHAPFWILLMLIQLVFIEEKIE